MSSSFRKLEYLILLLFLLRTCCHRGYLINSYISHFHFQITGLTSRAGELMYRTFAVHLYSLIAFFHFFFHHQETGLGFHPYDVDIEYFYTQSS